MTQVAVVGGGLAGISCALHLAEHNIETHLFEAAPQLGGRTRSFYDRESDTWVDNGPHLLSGAYHHSKSFFARYDIGNITWQPKLNLPLWDAERGHFSLNPQRIFPLPFSLAWAASRLPGHDLKTLFAVLRLGAAVHRKVPNNALVSDWLQSLHIPIPLQRDLLIPLCLGSMNEPATSSPAASYARVLREAFSDHNSACLGWFSQPFARSLIEPLHQALRLSGVQIQLSSRITNLNQDEKNPSIEMRSGETRRFDYIVLCLPAHARNRLLGHTTEVHTRPITNVHLWFDDNLHLPHPFVGGIGTLGHWFFDIDQQMPDNIGRYRHFCAVISAEAPINSQQWTKQLCDELSLILTRKKSLRPVHVRMIQEQRATTLIRSSKEQLDLPKCILDAGEQPQIGELPATIESAIRRGSHAAVRILEIA